MLYRERIGQILREERKKRRLSQTEAGAIIGVKHPVISKIENGRYTGSLRIYEKYITSMGFHMTIVPEGPQTPDFESLRELFSND